ncbi:MAG: hypothetical protein FJY91_03120 [Candidatus Harrisonbacteria bacterium]|nr:hypothetical protein [Candidatus Harrisonbacteria bacterium]
MAFILGIVVLGFLGLYGYGLQEYKKLPTYLKETLIEKEEREAKEAFWGPIARFTKSLKEDNFLGKQVEEVKQFGSEAGARVNKIVMIGKISEKFKQEILVLEEESFVLALQENGGLLEKAEEARKTAQELVTILIKQREAKETLEDKEIRERIFGIEEILGKIETGMKEEVGFVIGIFLGEKEEARVVIDEQGLQSVIFPEGEEWGKMTPKIAARLSSAYAKSFFEIEDGYELEKGMGKFLQLSEEGLRKKARDFFDKVHAESGEVTIQ